MLWRANGNWGTNYRDEKLDYKRSVKGRLQLFMNKAKECLDLSRWSQSYISMWPQWLKGRHWSLGLKFFKGNDLLKLLVCATELTRFLGAMGRDWMTSDLGGNLSAHCSVNAFCPLPYLWNLHQNKHTREWLDQLPADIKLTPSIK